jgi:hypothetical protein
MNTTDTEGYTTTDLNKVPIPANAILVDEWDGRMSERPGRFYRRSQRVIPASEHVWSEDITVSVQGSQYADGSLIVEIAVHCLAKDLPITASQARELAAALAAAAAEAEELLAASGQ